MDRKGQLKENSSSSMDIDSITQAYYVVWCHIKSMIFFFPRPRSSGMLEESNFSCSLFYSVFSISALGMEVFWRWIVRSDRGCLVFCDILVAGREQRITNVLIAPLESTHTSFQLEPPLYTCGLRPHQQCG